MVKKRFFCKALALLVGCAMTFSWTACNEKEDGVFVQNSKYVTVTEFTKPVCLAHENVLNYLNTEPETLVTSFLPADAPRADKGIPVVITFVFSDADRNPALFADVEISETENFAVVTHTQAFDLTSNTVEIYNLKTQTQYFFRVNVALENGKIHTKTGTFTTAASPRFINLDGASNVRDIGGWKTEDGRVIKQGLLFRGGEIDGGKNTGHPDFCLTEKGVEQLLSLGVVTDFDLRNEANKVSDDSILGGDVHREFYNANQYQSVFEPSYRQSLRKIITDLANPDSYPIYLHCTHGVDRAGTTVALLEALLGLSREDVVRDYELSAFYHNYAHVNRNMQNGGNILEFLAGFDNYEGNTLAEKCASFLLSVGVTQDEIDAIRSIFLG